MSRVTGEKLSGSIVHKGREYHEGDKVPEGVDMDRLRRLGLVGSGGADEPEHGTEVSETPTERPGANSPEPEPSPEPGRRGRRPNL